MSQWLLHDPVADESATMAINPNDRDNWDLVQNIQTTAGYVVSAWRTSDDHPLTGWGYGTQHRQSTPTDFTFSGVTLTQEQHEMLEYWLNKPNRFVLTDHLGQKWTVLFTEYDARYAPTRHWIWRHKYTIHGLSYGRKS